ncbi:TIGR03809 family protein [Bradyrhizobium cajani]|nr:TIGR03809 family protein [Bradyrhizobium cajani]MCP3370337.1 TIGR03809 family protein [Bradyrhizobium cajani]
MAVSRDIAARWCALAEQRLEHLSEMFETGRWRRYHSEIAFLENIQEAKRAVQTWRALATGADVAAAAASVTPAFGWSPATMPRVLPREQQAQTVQPKAVHIAAETAVPVRLDPKPDVLAEITEAPIAPLLPSAAVAPPTAPAAMASFAAPAEMPPLKAPAARAPLTAPAVRPPVATPAAMAALLPQFAPPAAEIVAAPERVVEFTLSLDGLEAKYPLLRNAF